jgi:hypothetical protein
MSQRIKREKKTIDVMVQIYCRDIHKGSSERCSECRELTDYALTRLDRCPFQEGKPTCSKCTVHCFRSEMRSKVREVMRYSGPRMLAHHPILAIRHLMDGLRRPEKGSGEGSH